MRDFFEFGARFGADILDLTCESQGDQVTCMIDVVDAFTRAIGPESATRTFVAVVADGRIVTFISAEGSDDPQLDDFFRWVYSAHPSEAMAACEQVLSGACSALIVERLDEWVAQR